MYYFTKIIEDGFEDAIEKVTAALAEEGFGILTQIDVESTLKKKIGAEFRPYRILGACNPPFAYKALSVEDKIGTMLPCNVVVQINPEGKTEVTAVDPKASMAAVENEDLAGIAEEIRRKLKNVIASL
ncbi:MAG: DUF302 domain-containing protein [Spirochaetaceae bacterium]|nr:DUF302 domain-containing protein [Spirochaetaceae bacterium]MDT8299764.1 DUF302 domain-containing protein [Spirochaetaceae bacterium]